MSAADWIALFVRDGDRLTPAPEEDFEVARGYSSAQSKGPVTDGRRITLLAAKTHYRPQEPVRVIHVYEVLVPGVTLFVMGPKPVYGEYVDGRPVTPLSNPDFVYDGEVVESPGVDFNYEITTYEFTEPGRHEIDWRFDDLRSNTLRIDVSNSSPTSREPLTG